MITVKVIFFVTSLLLYQSAFSSEKQHVDDSDYLSSVNPNVVCSGQVKKPSSKTVEAFKKGKKNQCTKKS